MTPPCLGSARVHPSGAGWSPTGAEISRALRRAARGQTLDVDEASALLAARGAALDRPDAPRLRGARPGLADAGRPGVVTYSRKVFIPLTRLCRDRCHYCTFVTVPGSCAAGRAVPGARRGARRSPGAGAALGCKEALFTLGDRPEDRWPEAREWLDEHGYDSTLDYVRAMAIRCWRRPACCRTSTPA